MKSTIPASSGVYVVRDGEQVLYVGCSINLRSRIRRQRYNFPRDVSFTFEAMERPAALKRERELIIQLRPARNYATPLGAPGRKKSVNLSLRTDAIEIGNRLCALYGYPTFVNLLEHLLYAEADRRGIDYKNRANLAA